MKKSHKQFRKRNRIISKRRTPSPPQFGNAQLTVIRYKYIFYIKNNIKKCIFLNTHLLVVYSAKTARTSGCPASSAISTGVFLGLHGLLVSAHFLHWSPTVGSALQNHLIFQGFQSRQQRSSEALKLRKLKVRESVTGEKWRATRVAEKSRST